MPRNRCAAAVVVGGLALSLVTAASGPVSAAPAVVSRGAFVVLSTAPTLTAVAGRAQLVRIPHGRTHLSVHLTGLARGQTYGVHLHNEPCSAANPGGGHYKQDSGGLPEPPNELWASSDPKNPKAGVTANAAGNGQGRGVATWFARNTARAVVVHAPGGAKLACADLT